MASQKSRCIAELLENRMMLVANALDPSFGTNGIATASFQNGIDNAHAVAVQADGKIIVVGDASFSGSGKAPFDGFFAARFNPDGTPDDGSESDTTPGDHFGIDGMFTHGEGNGAFATSVAIQKDGKIILAGTADSIAKTGVPAQQYWLLIRLNPDGSLDKTFNDGGVAGEQFSFSNTPLAGIALQSDGKIVAVGTLDDDFLVARFNSDGTPDFEFGQGGSVTTDFANNEADAAVGVVIDNIGNIVVGGSVEGSGVLKGI